jgi:hypothetical protein
VWVLNTSGTSLYYGIYLNLRKRNPFRINNIIVFKIIGMKQIMIVLFVIGRLVSPVFSQIIIDQSDMPAPGDTLRVSLTNVVPDGFAKTAMDTAWNYAALEALSQRLDTFVNTSSTPSVYQLFFVLQGGANLASPRSGIPIPGLPVTQGFTFFKNSTGSFSDLGSAYTIQGLPLPAKYDIPDKQYQFPMTPGLTWSSASSFEISLPDLLSYSTKRIRNSVVDGWGALTTPFGTFQTVRVKSNLNIRDSVYIDSLGSGFAFNRDITEYKWLAKGEGIPVLQVNEEAGLATATYRDIFRMSAQPLSVTLGPDTAVPQGTILALHATVTGGTSPYMILWNTLDTGNTITVTVDNVQTYSVFVMDATQNAGMAQKSVYIQYPPGVEEMMPNQLQVCPNPTHGLTVFTIPEKYGNAAIQVVTCQGKLMLTGKIELAEGDISTNLSNLPDGLYLVRIATANNIYSTKIQIIK